MLWLQKLRGGFFCSGYVGVWSVDCVAGIGLCLLVKIHPRRKMAKTILGLSAKNFSAVAACGALYHMAAPKMPH